MCGIFAVIRRRRAADGPLVTPVLLEAAFRLQHRGPDSSVVQQVEKQRVVFAFHRLAINDLTNAGNMPLQHKATYLICNGEIYNCHALAAQYGFVYATRNDCESILHLYEHFDGDVQRVAAALDGVFAFVLYDAQHRVVCAANDRYGVRPLYEVCTDDQWALASEPCALAFCNAPIRFFRPGTVSRLDLATGEMQSHSHYLLPVQPSGHHMSIVTAEADLRELLLDGLCAQIRITFIEAVRKRFALCERTMGALLSGGLDSSLVVAVLASEMRRRGATAALPCFTVGMSDDAPDVRMARLVAEHVGTDLHVTLVDARTCLDVLPAIVATTQSTCRTTNRASTFNWLACRAAAAHGVTVLFNGDFSDEVWFGYLFGALAPTAEAFFATNVELVRDIHRYDSLRSDRCAAHFSIECRTPFADRELVDVALQLPPVLKMFSRRAHGAADETANDFSAEHGFPMEKWLLRRAFAGTDDRGRPWLPPQVLWRHKEAFSDAVSCAGEQSWHRILAEHCAAHVSDADLAAAAERWPHCTPHTKEGVLYRRLLDEHGLAQAAFALDREWMPRFVGAAVTDPSARELAHHHDRAASKTI